MYNAGIGTPYWYEWLIGIVECLKMLTDDNIESVIFQSSDYKVLDDVVVKYTDGTSTNIQVKHTDSDSNFTYAFLSKDSLLRNLAKEWKSASTKNIIREIQLVTNKKWGVNKIDGKCSMLDFVTKVYPKMKTDASYVGDDEYERKAVAWFKKELHDLGTDINKFIQVFSFRGESNSSEIEQNIRKQIEIIVGTQKEEVVVACMNSILSQLRFWATSRREIQEIFKEDVYLALCPEDVTVPQYELYPEKPVFGSRIEYAKQFIDKLKNTDKRIFFLQGLPGSGKTNFVSYLAQVDNSIVDFRFYTYLPVNKENVSYSDDEGFYLGKLLWGSILAQLKNKFSALGILSKLKFPIVHQFLTVSEMRGVALKYLPIYSEKIGRECYFFIDGIDHAARSHSVRDSFLLQIPQPEELDKGVKFVLVGQPINEQYPTWFVKNPLIEYDVLPPLDQDDVMGLIKQSSCRFAEIDIKSLAQTIISVSGDNALNVLFAIEELRRISEPVSYEQIEALLKERGLNKCIDKYYEWIINSIDDSMLLYKLEAVFAYASRKLTLNELALLCAHDEEDVLFLLNKLYPLVLKHDGLYYVYHNDVRLFFKNKTNANSSIGFITEQLCETVYNAEQLTKYQYDILFGLLLRQENIVKLFEMINIDYAMNSVFFDVSFDRLLGQFYILLRMLQEKKEYGFLPQASRMWLVLAQFAKCMQYYEKQETYLEQYSQSNKKTCEKYILSLERDLQQIIDDIYFLFLNNLNKRGEMAYDEYFASKNISDLLKAVSGDNERSFRLGFICRYNQSNIRGIIPREQESYLDFVDGWLEASSYFVSKKDFIKTFSFCRFYHHSLYDYAKKFFVDDHIISEEDYVFIKQFLLKDTMPIYIIVEMCVYGLFKGYPVVDAVEYLGNHLERLISEISYKNKSDALEVFFKTWFCIFKVSDKSNLKNIYIFLLEEQSISAKKRGYKPAMAQWSLAEIIFEIYYGNDCETVLASETIMDLLYFTNKYGFGSCYECNANVILLFLRHVFLNFARQNNSSPKIDQMCEVMLQILAFDSDNIRYFPELDELFYVKDDKKGFLNLANYWCGEKGKAWSREYTDTESICDSICKMLCLFGENDIANLIQEKLRLRLFGYVGHKDYSLFSLLEYYRKLPLSEDLLFKHGLRLLEISDSVNDIGDNRISRAIDKKLFQVSASLGYKYLNALFELKNRPGTLIYWRLALLSALIEHIDNINDDNELVSIYKLTNAWINAEIESYGLHSELEKLKKYNYFITRKIKNDVIKKELQRKGNCDYSQDNQNHFSESTYDYGEFYDLLEKGHYDAFENYLINHMEANEGGLRLFIIKIKDNLPKEYIKRFANKCVCEYIKRRGKYGYLSSRMDNVFENYYMYFDVNSWNLLLKSIIDRHHDDSLYTVSIAAEDIEIFTLYYLLAHHPEQLEAEYSSLCEVHEALVTANRRIPKKKYSLEIDSSIKSIADLVRFQLNR